MNYFTLIEDIKRTSLQFAKEFYEGDVYEFLNSGNHKYPSIILTTQNVSTTDNINSISGTLFCVDRLTDDSSNRLEIQSNAFNKLQRIISALEENTINLQSNTYTPFTEKFADLCGGMFVEFSFQYVGESLCDDLEIKEIELTQNGIYDVIGYDRAIVNVRHVVNLEDITITDNGEYTCGEGFDGFGKVNVDVQPPKVKLLKLTTTNPIINNSCLNDEGMLDYDYLLDTSVTTDINFTGMTNLVKLRCSNWDTSALKTLYYFVRNCPSLVEVDVSNFNTSNVTNIGEAFRNSPKLSVLDLKKWDMSKVTNANYTFYGCSALSTLIGDTTLEEVLENNIGCLNGLSVGTQLNHCPLLQRNSLRAIINGLAEVETTQTLTLGATLKAKLTEEDIAIATEKNWSIA